MNDQMNYILHAYRTEMYAIMQHLFPIADQSDIFNAIDAGMAKHMKNPKVVLDNIYQNKAIDTDLLSIVDYIVSREPILTPYGVMFKKPEDEENYLINLTVKKFLAERKVFKSEMFKYPKGSEMFNKYNLLQLLAKIDANGFYGAAGNYSCLFYNLNVATSTTAAGQSAISVAAMAFESFLANNVRFRALNEITTFIHNVAGESRVYHDHIILDHDIHIADVFEKLIETCGHGYIPTADELEVVWKVLSQQPQIVLNRIFYKNNLFAFIYNSKVEKMMLYLLTQLKAPYLDPNEVPEEIAVELESFWELLEEFVFYNHGYIDRIGRLTYLPRKVTAIIDTDSNIVLLDPWFQYWREKTENVDMLIKTQEYECFDDALEKGENSEYIKNQPYKTIDPEIDFDILNDDIIEIKRHLDPTTLIAEDGVRYSIINILAYCLSKMVNSAMVEYTKATGSYRPGKVCKLNMKNEFLFKRLLITDVKKNYASIIELQEGNIVEVTDDREDMDIKGLPLNKSSLNPTAQHDLKSILYEDVLKDPNVSPVKVIRKLMVVERKIFDSLSKGEKKYYKPLSIKSMNAYDDPMRISGIKASIVWNLLRDPEDEVIDLEKRNAIEVVKIDLNPKNVHNIKDSHPEVYQRALAMLEARSIAGSWGNEEIIKKLKTVTAIAIPLDTATPDWVLEFIDYNTIINDNLTNFSNILNSLGIKMIAGKVNYTNILNI